MKKNILIFGATSAIAQELAKLYAASGHRLFLVGRNEERLSHIADDLKMRGASKTAFVPADLNDFAHHQAIIDAAIKEFSYIDTVLVAHGSLPDQKHCENDFELTYQELKTNLISSISLLSLLANYFITIGKGQLIVISSVAGDRGRQSNYIYGTAKAGLSTYLQGLRNRLSKSNIKVITIKPGFVDTPMTKHFKKGLLWCSAETVAKKITKAVERNKQVVYVPGFWRYIMLVIKLIPERLFCRLSL